MGCFQIGPLFPEGCVPEIPENLEMYAVYVTPAAQQRLWRRRTSTLVKQRGGSWAGRPRPNKTMLFPRSIFARILNTDPFPAHAMSDRSERTGKRQINAERLSFRVTKSVILLGCH